MLPNVRIPKSFDGTDKQVGTAEDSSFVFSAFERYLGKLLKVMSENQKNEEAQVMM